jgi:hypothetical protein
MARYVPLVRGKKQNVQDINIFVGSFRLDLFSSEIRQYSGCLLRDMGVTLLTPRNYMGTRFSSRGDPDRSSTPLFWKLNKSVVVFLNISTKIY